MTRAPYVTAIFRTLAVTEQVGTTVALTYIINSMTATALDGMGGSLTIEVQPCSALDTRANHPRPQLAVQTRPVLFRCFPFRERDGESRHRRRREPRLVPGDERVVVREGIEQAEAASPQLRTLLLSGALAPATGRPRGCCRPGGQLHP